MSATDVNPDVESNGAAGDGGWLHDTAGRAYIPAQGRRGRINRQGEETVAQALERDAQPRDRKPRRKPAKPGKPPPPKSVDLREVEEILAEAFKSPAMPCAAFGDEWAANHFATWGPYLARNMVRASEHNPWLRKKLEKAASGGDVMMQVMTMVGVGGAIGMYTLPPLVHWFNLPVPEQARMMLGVPARENAPSPPPNPAAAQAERTPAA